MNQCKSLIKTISVLILLISFISKVEAQEPLNSWTTIATVSNVTLSYQTVSCQGSSKMFLKIENNNLSNKTVSWTFWGSSTFKNITINAEETQTGSCNVNSLIELTELIPVGQTIEDLNAIINVN